MIYDVIGDIHGQATKLEALLRRLGYTPATGSWIPPQGRQAVFLGDLIDRGPEQVKVIDIVRSMQDAGHARCVLGNHELNAIGYRTERKTARGDFLREHSDKNIGQHREFLSQVGEGSALHGELVDWFKTLPPSLDLGGIRAVHAWWHQPYVDVLADRMKGSVGMDDEFLAAAFDKESEEWRAMDGLTKGLEIKLPPGLAFSDHGGVERHEMRTKWWHEDPRTYRDIAIVEDSQRHRVPEIDLPADYLGQPVKGAPVFFGHYWMTGTPSLQAPKVACLDYSGTKDAPVVAYRWEGEERLTDAHFVRSH